MVPSEMMEDGSSPITRFYEGKTIFMTGGTGFMGKVMIEKLLTSCPKIKRIYVLIREKKGKDKVQRLAKVKEGRVFQALDDSHPERLDKVEALEGDLELPGLGLSSSDLGLLRDVDVVFNVAATLNFNEELRKSLAVNVLATKTLLEICLTMKNLKSFVHVSTAYGNCDQDLIEERIYPSPVNLEELMKECEECTTDQQIEELTKRVLGKRPNTYTLTKAIAENVVEKYKTHFPIAIVRPSIVTSALRSPQPGWVDCRTGVTGLLVLVGSGLLRVAYGDSDIVLDMVPVDLVNNAIIVVAWRTALMGVREPKVYNVTSGKRNPICLGTLVNLIVIQSREIPQDNAVWYPSASVTTNRFLYCLANFWMHLLPAYLHDTLVPSSDKVSLVKIQSNVRKVTEALEVFISNTYHFSDENLRQLRGDMSVQDRDTFYCDVQEVSWGHYIGIYVRGARKYLLGQEDDSLASAKERMSMFSMKHKALKIAAAGVVYYLTAALTTPYLVGHY